jgi:hypothetical protein
VGKADAELNKRGDDLLKKGDVFGGVSTKYVAANSIGPLYVAGAFLDTQFKSLFKL